MIGNGSQAPAWVGPWDPIQVNRFQAIAEQVLTRNREKVKELVQNYGASGRFMFARGEGGQADETDPRRSIHTDCGWPLAPSPETYARLWGFDSIATRAVSFPPSECWQVSPDVFESEDEEEITTFEQALDDLFLAMRGEGNWFTPQAGKGGNPLWELYARADKLSRIGQYGVIWYGFDDEDDTDPRMPVKGLEELGSKPVEFVKGEKKPVLKYDPSKVQNKYRLVRNAEVIEGKDNPNFDPKKPTMPSPELKGKPGKPQRGLAFARAYQEVQASVIQWESNKLSPRYCQPVQYQITALDPSGGYYNAGFPSSTEVVHWSRVQHIADIHHHAVSGDTLAVPAMQPILYDLLDGRKISGAAGESYYRNAFLKIFFETHPQLGGDVLVDDDEIADMMEQMVNGGQQHGRLSGMTANPIAPAVSDPNPFLDAKYKRIAISMGYPKRIFEGSERGELASSQDEDTHSDRVSERQDNYVTPRIIAPGINRLILCGVLPPPESGNFYVEWPSIGTQDELKKAQVFSARMTAFGAYISGGVEAVLPVQDMLVREAGFTTEEAETMLEAAAEAEEEKMLEQQAKAEELGMEEVAPGEFVNPEEKAKQDKIALEQAKAGGGKPPAFGGGGPPKKGGNPFAKNEEGGVA